MGNTYILCHMWYHYHLTVTRENDNATVFMYVILLCQCPKYVDHVSICVLLMSSDKAKYKYKMQHTIRPVFGGNFQ